AALGQGSLADYAAYRLDFSERKTRDLIELVERAAGLPRIRNAFEQGEIHYTKLRTIARVATAESEAEWLERARELNSRALEREVAAAVGERQKVRMVLEFSEEQLADIEDAVGRLRRERNESVSREDAIVDLIRRGASRT